MPINDELVEAIYRARYYNLLNNYTTNDTTNWSSTAMNVNSIKKDYATPIPYPLATKKNWRMWLRDNLEELEKGGYEEHYNKCRDKVESGKAADSEVTFIEAYDSMQYEVGV